MASRCRPDPTRGGRYGIYVESASGCKATSGGGNIGLYYQDFTSSCGGGTWAWVVIADEMTNSFTSSIGSGGWPVDWWSDGRSPFPSMVAVQVVKAGNEPGWSADDTQDSADPAYVMFKNLQATYQWSIFSSAFESMISDGFDPSAWQSEFESSSWRSLHHLKSHLVAYYLSRAAGTDLSSTLNSGSVGEYPPGGWNGCCFVPENQFYSYQINLASVTPTDQIQTITGTQRGIIQLRATATSPDWQIRDVTFWYSTDDITFYYIGSGTNIGGTVVSGVWGLSWNTASALNGRYSHVWVLSVSHSESGVESAWSVSSPFAVDNTLGSSPFLVFVRGSDRGIYWNYYSGSGWSGWNQLPGATPNSPGAVECGNVVYLAVQGSDDGIYFGSFNGGTFSGWGRLPGSTISAPSIAADSSCSLYMVVRGSDNGIYVNKYMAGGWQGWVGLPGATPDSPGAVVLSGSLWVAVRGTDNGIYVGQMNIGTGTWGGFNSISGATPSAPRLTVDSTNLQLYLVVRGSDNRIYINQYNGVTWAGFTQIPTGASPDAPGTVVSAGELYVCVRGTDNGIYCASQPIGGGSSWVNWVKLTGATSSGPTLSLSGVPLLKPVNQPISPPPAAIPEYPLGLPTVVVILVLAYAFIRRKSKNQRSSK